MGIRVSVVRAGNPNLEIVLDRSLEQRVEVAAGTPQALARGYNEALVLILGALERELAGLELRR
jgi:hypothetical protein